MNEARYKILVIGPLPPPVGGMATVVQNLQSGLTERCDMEVVNNAKTTAPDRSLAQALVAQVRLLWRTGARILGSGAQLVHIHTCSNFTFWRNSVDVLLARLLGRRVVLHIHGAMFHKFLAGLSVPKAALARFVFGRCHQVIVLGEEWRKVLAPWCSEQRITVVPNGVPVSPDPVRPVDKTPHIICMANYEKRKGQVDLLRAVAACKSAEVRVSLLGFESEPGEQAHLQSVAAELGIGERVEVPGPKTGDEKQAYIDRATLFCLPSYDEGLPMAMLEAMAQGIPSIVTCVGAIPEAVANGSEGLLYEPGDIAGLTGHINRLLGDSELARRLAINGRERVQREFSLEATSALVLSAYQAAMSV